ASVMFELFTGEKLFPGDEAEDIIKNIETMPLPRASSVRPGLPSRLDEILAGPLSRKPIDRPSRPATVLRSLIELSYESSIMATALDVAEAVSAVLPARRTPGAAMLDDVIRKQLGDAKDKSVARRTAVTDGKPPSTTTVERNEVSTGLFRKISDDGISRLEEVEVDPTSVRRDLSEHEMPAASSADSGLHKLLDAYKDPDRRTEVGGPPTGAVPKSDPDAPSEERPPSKQRAQTKTGSKSKSVTAEVPGTRARWPIALAAVLVVGGGVAAWRMMRTESPVVTPVAHDASVAPTDELGQLEIDPDVEGATGTVTGEDGVAHPFGPTSHAKKVRLRVTANKDLKIHLEAPGYAPMDRTARVEPNVVMSIAPSLQKARASLKVTTTPSGAQVTLGGRLLGETPLNAMDLDAAKGVDLVITHAGYEPTRMKVDLVLGKPSEITQTLKELPKLGAVQIRVTGAGWANVYYKGKNLGQNRTLQGFTTFKLPVGKQQLVIENPPTKKKKTITIDVTGGTQAPIDVVL
ncbi:MAG: PEGA domain-containing protein, partial [Deltaproteobacteria bacterium]|nr:PEGA domain-containing protein [Deltaproteobacteria bacterium]